MDDDHKSRTRKRNEDRALQALAAGRGFLERNR